MKDRRLSLLRLFTTLALATLCAPLLRAEESPKARFVWIEGEQETTTNSAGPDSCRALRKSLTNEFPGCRIETSTLHFIHAPAPTDTVYVLAGPKRDLSAEDAGTFKALVDGGARFLVCIDPVAEHEQTDLPNLRAALRAVGVTAGADLLTDPSNARTLKPLREVKGAPARRERSAFAARFNRSEHGIFATLPADTEVILVDACRVEASAGAKDPFVAQEILSTSVDAYSQPAAGGRGPAGPVAVAAWQRFGKGRLLVVGDSSFLTDGIAEQTGRRDAPFFIASLKWLAEGIEAAPPAKPAAEEMPEPEPIVLWIAVSTAAVLIAAASVFGRKT